MCVSHVFGSLVLFSLFSNIFYFCYFLSDYYLFIYLVASDCLDSTLCICVFVLFFLVIVFQSHGSYKKMLDTPFPPVGLFCGYVLCPGECFPIHLKGMCILLLLDGIIYLYVSAKCMICHFGPAIFLVIFCSEWSVHSMSVGKNPLLLCVIGFFLRPLIFCFIYLGASVLDAYMLQLFYLLWLIHWSSCNIFHRSLIKSLF